MTTTTSNAVRQPAASCPASPEWSKQRILFLMAGTFTVTGTALAAAVNPWFALIPAAVGANQLLLVATGWCPMSKLLDTFLPTTPA
jgi:hypothetical protein